MRGTWMDESIALMRAIITRYRNSPKWDNALLGDVKALSNTHIGDVGQDFVGAWCAEVGLAWAKSSGRRGPWDAKIEGVTFEVKTATEDLTGNFQFNHIRYHREYQAILCLGVSPDAVLFDAWRKGDVSEGRAGHLVSMDKGSSATFKLTKKRVDMKDIGEFAQHLRSVVDAIKGDL